MDRTRRLLLGLALLGAIPAAAQTWYWHSSPAGNEVQKSWNWTSLPSGGGTRPATVRDDAFADTAMGPWTFIDSVAGKLPAGQPASSVARTGGRLVLKAAGADVWADHNQFAGVYRTDIKGAFDVTVRVDSQSRAHEWSKAGIMIWNDYRDFRKGGGFAVLVTPDHGFVAQYDSTDGPTPWHTLATGPGRMDSPWPGSLPSTQDTLPCWLRVVKWKDAQGRWTFTGYYRTGLAKPWTRIYGDYRPQNTADDSHIGLFVTSHSTTTLSAAVFDDFEGGGDLPEGQDLRFSGTGPGADANAVLGANVGAKSADFTGYAGAFSFGGWTLTLAGNATFPQEMSIVPGTGALAFSGAGPHTLVAKANDTLPRIHKSGAGILTLGGANPLVADSLHIAGGTVDLGNRNAWLGGFGSSGGALQGFVGGSDTLTVAGRADFSGLEALDMDTGGTVSVFARGDGRRVVFTPGARTFRHVVLRTEATGTEDVAIEVAGDLQVAGNLHFRGLWGPKSQDGTVDFRAHDADVTVGGDIVQTIAGTLPPAENRNAHPILMGDGLWKAGGNVTLSLPGLQADQGTLELTGSGLQVLTVADSLHAVRHRSPGILRLGARLRAHSLEQSGAGTLDLGGKGLRLAGNLAVTGGAAGITGLGDTLAVGGDAAFKGTGGDTLPLSSQTRWHLRVAGALSADSAFIGNSDARGGSAGLATAACVDRGLNFNWSFGGGVPTAAPAIAREPAADTTVYPGQVLALSAGVSGHAPFAWEWRRRGSATVLSTDSVLVLDSVAFADSGSYRVIVSNSSGKDTSAEARVRVLPPPVGALILRQPADTAVKAGGKATFSVSVAGTRPIQYEWRRAGRAAPVSTDSVLVVGPVVDSLDGAAFYCIVSNLGGTARDTSAEARILVRACDTLAVQVSAESLAVDEGRPFSVGSRAACADGHRWTVVSGPSPRLHDPGADTLAFTAPRVTGDTAIRYLYTAYLGEASKSRAVVVRVREAIPDPEFTMVPKVAWNGLAPLVVRPALGNKAKLDLFPAHPLVFAWSIEPLAADSSRGGDSLSLRDPLEDGPVAVELCLDNGGARRCDTTLVEVKRIPTGLMAGALRLPGDLLLSGRSLFFGRPGRARVFDFRGRVLFDARAAAGEVRELPEDARRAFAGLRARLVFTP